MLAKVIIDRDVERLHVQDSAEWLPRTSTGLLDREWILDRGAPLQLPRSLVHVILKSAQALAH